jgi:subtilisin family serine protease
MNKPILNSKPSSFFSKGIASFVFAALFIPFAATAQNADIKTQWQHADMATDGLPGVSAVKAHAYMAEKGKTATPVVVAIIDSGSETFHKDLNANIWTNKGEIANNGIDDDKNGYIDDLHGWSFIGGKGGDVKQDNLEITRVYSSYAKRFEGKDAASIAPVDRADFAKYEKIKVEFEKRLNGVKQEVSSFNAFFTTFKANKELLAMALGNDFTTEQLAAYEPTDDAAKAAKGMVLNIMVAGINFDEYASYYNNQLEYSYNVDFNPRAMVGDNYSNPRERNYGNNHIDGPEALHGTHVAGIVGATNNGTGMDGICKTAQLMIIRCVPDGDERDKDVANAIRYAADNGARVINMSFGKSYSPYKDVVDEAVMYAESKGVLLIHAAGNDSKDVDVKDNFPTPRYANGKTCSTWLEIGASDNSIDHLSADFSNYGDKTVDIYAPGVDIYATILDNEFGPLSGTSMASPVTAGVAASILSYYPNLTAKQVRDIIIKSGISYKKHKVVMPGDEEKRIKFGKLSKTGKVVNLYEALKLAEKMSK